MHVLFCKKLPNELPEWLYYFTFPLSMHEWSFLYIIVSTWNGHFYDFSHSYCVCYDTTLRANDDSIFPHVPLPSISLVKCLFADFTTGSFFLFCCFENSSYTPDIKPSLHMWFADIFTVSSLYFHSGCSLSQCKMFYFWWNSAYLFFTLLIVH